METVPFALTFGVAVFILGWLAYQAYKSDNPQNHSIGGFFREIFPEN